jgi:hypothetical protein
MLFADEHNVSGIPAGWQNSGGRRERRDGKFSILRRSPIIH